MKKISPLIFIIILVCISVFLTSCSSEVSCPQEQVDAYVDDMDSLIQEFEDNLQLMYSANIFTLSDIIGNLQEIRRNAADLQYPECALYTHDISVTSMQRVIDIILAYLNSGGELGDIRKTSEVGFMWKTANEEYENFKSSPVESYDYFSPLQELIQESPEENIDTRRKFIDVL